MQLGDVSKLYEIIWSDPAGNEIGLDDLELIVEDPETYLSQFLVNTNCFGRIIHEDKTSILLSHYIDANGLTKFKTIPKSLIQKRIPYRRNDQVNLKGYWRNKRTAPRRRLVEVDWLAPSDRKTTLNELGTAQWKIRDDFFLPVKSYGVVATEDADGLILKYYQNDIKEREVQIIPQAMIKKVTPFYSQRS
jgi:hypothetical protein